MELNVLDKLIKIAANKKTLTEKISYDINQVNKGYFCVPGSV